MIGKNPRSHLLYNKQHGDAHSTSVSESICLKLKKYFHFYFHADEIC